MKFNRCMDMSNVETYNTVGDKSAMVDNYPAAMPATMAMPDASCGCGPQVMMCPPVMECPQERCCHRVINYEVPHIIPCHTKMINHHVYRHTYQPCFSYSEEDVCSSVYDQPCCK